jgi:hypothetical protein
MHRARHFPRVLARRCYDAAEPVGPTAIHPLACMTHRHASSVLLILAAVAACVVIALYEPPDPIRERLDRVQLGMTHDQVEVTMDMAPDLLADVNGRDLLRFRGRSGVAEVHIDQRTWCVVEKRWASVGRELEIERMWRWDVWMIEQKDCRLRQGVHCPNVAVEEPSLIPEGADSGSARLS